MAKKIINLRAEDGFGAFRNETPYRVRLSRSVAAVLTDTVVPMPPVQVPTLLVADVSKWAGYTDFSIMKSRGVRAVWIKASQGLWVDGLFDQHTQGATDDGLDFGYYHFIDPDQTAVTPEAAAQHCADLVKGREFLSMWVDAERRGPLDQSGLLDYLVRWSDTFFGLIDTVKEIYTRFSFFNPYVARSFYWEANDFGLFAARYHLGLSTPWSDGNYHPLDWQFAYNNFDGWQYSADGNGLGAYFGLSSDSVDLSLIHATEDDFRDKYNIDADPPPDPDLERRVEALEIKTADHCQRITALENDTPPDPTPTPETVSVEITDQHKAHYYKDTDKAGKPIMLTRDDLDPLLVGQVYECNRNLVLHDKDSPLTHTTIASGGGLYYRIAEGFYSGTFIRADKSKEVSA